MKTTNKKTTLRQYSSVYDVVIKTKRKRIFFLIESNAQPYEFIVRNIPWTIEERISLN